MMPMHDWVRFVPFSRALDYVLLGWMPKTLEDTPHGRYAVIMVWRCCCREMPLEPLDLTPNANS
jgi:hypothetical protein